MALRAVICRHLLAGNLDKVKIRWLGASTKRFLSDFYPIEDDVYGLSNEQKQLRQTVFQFVQKEIAPIAAEIDRTNDFPGFKDFMKKCGKLGLLGITAPAKYGGTEAPYFDHFIVGEEMARASAAVTLSCGAHSNLCINQIVLHGTEKQKEKYLPKLCTGDLIGALAMSEHGSGSDVISMSTKADRKVTYTY